MFLSTENPPNDPLSSSSNLLHLSSPSHDLALSHLSNFSIRDYAYSNRKKSIKNSWPFSYKTLHLLSTHGVKDPLPPFSTSTNQFETLSSKKQVVSYVHQGRDHLAISETSKGVFRQSKTIENGLFTSTSVSKSSKVESSLVASTSKKNNPNSKKCGRGGMVKSKEDSCGGLLTTSESTMASKTCPICKTFSSASNTTLNAHIDQCLSTDSVVSVVPPVSSKPSKPRVKPRMKVKTMVDIYASAKGCTLEDLDRRNGTKWVSILSYTNRGAADKPEVSRKQKVSPVGVGPVYIDAKGQKLRILSEFGEKKTFTTTPLREQRGDVSSEMKCLSQGSKGNNACSRKRRRGRKPHKFVKLTNDKATASEQIPEYPRGFSGEGSSTSHRRIYDQRMLAERNEKGHKLYTLRDQPSESDDDSWSEERVPTVVRGTATVSSPLNKQKLQKTCGEAELAGKKRSLIGSKGPQKKDEMLAGGHLNTFRFKKSRTSIQEEKYPPVKKLCSSASRLSLPASKPNAAMELKKARLEFSDREDEEETKRWESEMTQERELSDDDYICGNNRETDDFFFRSNLSSSGYVDYDDDEESSEEEEDNNKRENMLDKTDDTGAEFYQSDTPPSADNNSLSEGEMYYSEEVGNMSYEQTACEDNARFDSEVGQGNLFVEVDTIPIPGPPGSFLPSPRDMGHDENLGNSSVITSQLQSSIDQLDRNSSESPVSAISNFAAGRLNFPAEFRESFSSDIPATTPMSFGAPSHCGTNDEAELITSDKTTPSGFRNNDHEPCCCQRKDEGITLNHQASHLLQRRAASSSPAIAMNMTKPPSCLDPNHPFERSPYVIQQDLDLQSKFSSRTNVNSPIPPSPSNPVLRLMGKDLMVMNQGEETSPASLKPSPHFLDPPPPCTGTGLYFDTGLYLRNGFESTQQPQTPKAQAPAQTQTQAPSAFRNNFDNLRYFSPS